MIPMDIQYVWSAKYQPRKPHVFNKVHTVCIFIDFVIINYILNRDTIGIDITRHIIIWIIHHRKLFKVINSM
jgi:hypothetical protein